MSELKNSFHTQLAIGILLNDENELEKKLDLLTAIGLAATNEETFKICEGFRDRLCSEEVQKVGPNDLCAKHQRKPTRDSWKEISDAINGVE
jgi:hypothetical protein